MNPGLRPHIALLFTNLFFAINYTLVKIISPSLVGPFGLNVLRIGFSLILFWTLWLFSKSRKGIQIKDIPRFLLCSLAGIVFNQLLFLKGLILSTAIHASLLVLITPIVITVFAALFLKEKFTIIKLEGLVIGIAGSFFLIMQKESGQQSGNYMLGDLILLISSIAYASYFILVKPLMKRYSPLEVVRWVFTFGMIIILPFGWKDLQQIQWNSFQWYHIISLVVIIFNGTFLAYTFNAYGIKHLGATQAGAYNYTQPIFAVLIATMVLGETLSWQKILSGILIFMGVYLVSFHRQKEPENQLFDSIK